MRVAPAIVLTDEDQKTLTKYSRSVVIPASLTGKGRLPHSPHHPLTDAPAWRAIGPKDCYGLR